MEEELAPLVKQAQVTQTEQNLNSPVWIGKLMGKDIIIAQTGIGKVNAAVATQHLVDTYAVAHVFNVGVAGGCHDSIKVGDVCLAKKVIQSDIDTTAFGQKKGELPEMKESFFPASFDQAIIQDIKKQSEDFHLHLGHIISADQFITDRQKVLKLGQEFKALAKDMESAAIGHACYLNQLPFTIIRGISDSSGGDACHEYQDNLQLAIDHSLSVFINYFQNFKI